MTLDRKNIIFIIVGPTASGKNTLLKMLQDEFKNQTMYSVSATTRTPRPNEKNGEQYYFLSEEDFEKKIKNDEFLEWEKVHTSHYGTLKSEYEKANNSNKDLLMEIDIKGALNIRSKLPKESVAVFIVPPSFEAMKDRIKKRQGFNEEDFKHRIESARKEYDTFLSLQNEDGKIDYFVVNDKLEEAYDKIRAIYLSETSKLKRLNKKQLEDLCKVEDL